MTAEWVAGSVRARALVRRRIGIDGARAMLGTGSLPAAVEMLARSPYGEQAGTGEPAARGGVHPGDDPQAAAQGIAAALLWNLRVLAGWLPAPGTQTLRVLAGWFEIANTEEHVRQLAGSPAAPPFALGSLATAWSRISAAKSREEVRAVLTASPWRDPGGAEPRDIQIGLRLVWAERVSDRLPEARPWALGGAALLLARELLSRDQPLSEPARAAARRALGPRVATDARSIDDLHASLPREAQWALDGISDTANLWQAEANWWRRLHRDCIALLARSDLGDVRDPGARNSGQARVVGAVGLLAYDAWLATGALGGVGRGREALELLDELA
jgi:hypothetical protein